jgi:hypothetical protein
MLLKDSSRVKIRLQPLLQITLPLLLRVMHRLSIIIPLPKLMRLLGPLQESLLPL